MHKNFNQKCLKMGGLGKGGGQSSGKFIRNRQDGLRQCERISIKSADFRTKRAGVLKWVFENVRKRSKIFKNIQKLSRNIRKYSKIFEIFADPCAFDAKWIIRSFEF